MVHPAIVTENNFDVVSFLKNNIFLCFAFSCKGGLVLEGLFILALTSIKMHKITVSQLFKIKVKVEKQ